MKEREREREKERERERERKRDRKEKQQDAEWKSWCSKCSVIIVNPLFLGRCMFLIKYNIQ